MTQTHEVYRQAPADEDGAINNREFYLHKCVGETGSVTDGWLVSTDPMEANTCVAWMLGNAVDGGPVTDKAHTIHVPCWRKKKLGYQKEHIWSQTFFQWANGKLEELAGQSLQLADVPEEVVMHEDAPQADPEDVPQEASTEKPKTHGGWAPRIADMIIAYENKDWKRCDRLVARFKANEFMGKLVKQKSSFRKGSSWHGGSSWGGSSGSGHKW